MSDERSRVGMLTEEMLVAELRDHWPFVLIAVGGLLAIAGSYFAARQQSQFERRTTARLEEAIASVTGGDSYAFLSPFEMVEPDGKGGFTVRARHLALRSEGRHPVYDVHILLEDATKQFEMLKESFQASGGTGVDLRAFMGPDSEVRQVWTPGNLPARLITLNFAPLELPENAAEQRYRWTISARNGRTFGEMNFRKIDGEWRMAWRAVRARQVVKCHSDSAYPRNSAGDVDWQGFGVTSVPGTAKGGSPDEALTVIIK